MPWFGKVLENVAYVEKFLKVGIDLQVPCSVSVIKFAPSFGLGKRDKRCCFLLQVGPVVGSVVWTQPKIPGVPKVLCKGLWCGRVKVKAQQTALKAVASRTREHEVRLHQGGYVEGSGLTVQLKHQAARLKREKVSLIVVNASTVHKVDTAPVFLSFVLCCS